MVWVATVGLFASLISLCLSFALDSGKRKKRGTEMEQIDCTPPEHILPGGKERPLCPLQPQNRDWKVEISSLRRGVAVGI